jgi:hypothetical protein
MQGGWDTPCLLLFLLQLALTSTLSFGLEVALTPLDQSRANQ